MIAIDLCKQQAPDTDPKAIQLINFNGSLSGNNNRLAFFKRNNFRFFRRNYESFLNVVVRLKLLHVPQFYFVII